MKDLEVLGKVAAVLMVLWSIQVKVLTQWALLLCIRLIESGIRFPYPTWCEFKAKTVTVHGIEQE